MIMQCCNPACGKRTTKMEAAHRNYRVGSCAYCGWGLEVIPANHNEEIFKKVDAIFEDTYLPLIVKEELMQLIYSEIDKASVEQTGPSGEAQG